MLRLIPVVIAAFFLSIHSGALLYITSTFLGRFFDIGTVSILYLFAAVVNIILFLLAPRLLKYFSASFLLLFFLFITGGATIGLAGVSSGGEASFLFIIYGSFLFMNYYFLDILLEEISKDSRTGEIRGIYFTFVNAGIALGPLAISLFSRGESLTLIFQAAALLLVPAILISLLVFKPKGITSPRNHVVSLRKWWGNSDIRHVVICKTALETFFAIMVIYVPIYLHGILGFAWTEIGVILTVALLPFVLLEWPAGEVADRFLGEKEIMGLGFFITGASLLVMPFTGKVFTAWMLLLLLSRVGASFIEIMTESYFFKHIAAANTELLSIFRLARPASIIIAAIFASVSLYFFSMEKLFFVLAVIMFFGFIESLFLKDTR